MEIKFKNKKLENLYKSNHLKEIINLYSFIIKIEKNGNIPITTKILKEESIIIFMNAIIWETKNPIEFQKITGKLIVSSEEIKNTSAKEIRKKLIDNIYKQVIKNKIMMI